MRSFFDFAGCFSPCGYFKENMFLAICKNQVMKFNNIFKCHYHYHYRTLNNFNNLL